MSIEPFIGTKISLISKVGIRYEGSLHSLNTDDSTIVLNEVRCMGTEGRSKGSEVPPSKKVHDFVVFRGEDVSDIIVNEPKPPAEEPEFQDPAVFKTYKKDEFENAAPPKTAPGAQKPTVFNAGVIASATRDWKKPAPAEDEPKDEGVDPVTGRAMQTFKFDDEPGDPSTYPINKPMERFAQQPSFDESDSDYAQTNQNDKGGPKVFYDKKSFYDNISHEKQLSKRDLKHELMKQREIDIATFGKFSIRNWQTRSSANRGRRYNPNQAGVKAGWEKNFPKPQGDN